MNYSVNKFYSLERKSEKVLISVVQKAGNTLFIFGYCSRKRITFALMSIALYSDRARIPAPVKLTDLVFGHFKILIPVVC